MPFSPIDYHGLIDRAMRGVVQHILEIVSTEGFSGDQHAYITFNTRHPGVHISETLRQKYPQEMTIVLQHQFWDLQVDDEGFSVGLSFGGQRENLEIPFSALLGYNDPSSQFGLHFKPGKPEESGDAPSPKSRRKNKEKQETATAEGESNVVALDIFRKK